MYITFYTYISKRMLCIFWYSFLCSINLYINLACLSVCLFVSNKRQNGWTDRAQIFCGTSRYFREGLWMIKIFKKCFVKKFKFLKIREYFFKNPQSFFFFVFKCNQKEHVHNLNSWLGAKRPKSLVYNIWLILLIFDKLFMPLIRKNTKKLNTF